MHGNLSHISVIILFHHTAVFKWDMLNFHNLAQNVVIYMNGNPIEVSHIPANKRMYIISRISLSVYHILRKRNLTESVTFNEIRETVSTFTSGRTRCNDISYRLRIEVVIPVRLYPKLLQIAYIYPYTALLPKFLYFHNSVRF